jgi:mannose/fructose/N-acetylgalactosamine-specific phosphotransferase system component IIC
MEFLASWADLIPLAVLAGVVGLDVVGFPQVMISRPIVAATLGGTLVGAPMAGLICGAALECLALEALPVGASRYPEWGSASVVAGAVGAYGASAAALPDAGVFTLAIVLGIMTAWVGGWTMVQQRRLIAHVAHRRLDQLAGGNRRTVVGLQVFGLSVDLARGALIGIVAFVPGRLAAQWAMTSWNLPDNLTRAIVVACVAAVAAAAVWKDFHATTGTRRLFLASLAAGTLWVVLRA